MRCPFCQVDDDKVIDSRAAEAGRVIRRRRECQSCKRRFTTYENVEQTVRLVVIKKDGTRAPYDRQKLITGVEKACYKRPVSAQTMQAMIDDIEEQLFRADDREVQSLDIGRMVTDRLRKVDQVAYVRFASVYKQFRDLDDLLDEIRDVSQTPPDVPGQGKLFSP